MDFKDIQNANLSIKTTDIKGKDYAEVNQRIKAFRMLNPNGDIKTEIISLEDDKIIMKATIIGEDGKELANGTAYEKENSTFINKTSYIENCETSAIGRALGMCGFGIDTSVASAEEVANAIKQQEEQNKIEQEIIDKTKIDAIDMAIENKNINDEIVLKVLEKYGYQSTSEIKNKDYMNIVKEFQKIV